MLDGQKNANTQFKENVRNLEKHNNRQVNEQRQ